MSETPRGNAASSTESPHRRQALVVGVNASPHSDLGVLNCAERDAEQMRWVLESAACGFSATSLCGERATSEAVQSAIFDLIDTYNHSDDFLLFYFSGHGRYVGDDVYLVTSNFNPRQVKFNRDLHLSLRLLRQLLYERTQAGRVLLILDCCYSGEIAGSGPDANLEDLFAQIRQYLGDNATAPSKTTAAPRDAQRWTLTAALSNEQAKEADSHSLLTKHILCSLRGETEAALHGGMVQLEHLVTYLRDTLAGQQSPMLIGTDGSKDCILARHPDKYPANTQSFLPDTLIRIREREPRFSGRPESLAQNFVGRSAELQVIRDKITAQAHTGGYLTIVGPPGQGKSSVIARLIADEGLAQAVYHFIPNEPGRDPQKPLLQEIIARLIVQHNLLHDLRTYAFEGKDREDLVRDFHGLLTLLGGQNIQETIYIDGLDQLPRELATDQRDLSFLPEQTPSGIVFVLGTRPDDTLEPFKSREPVVRHDLTAFSLDDFRLLLERRQVLAQVADQLAAFHTALQGNPLYLDRLAQELQHNPQLLADDIPAIIGRLTANPRNIFGLTLRRLQRSPLWQPVLRPILGLLLVAQEPLHRNAIQSFVQCTDDLAFSQELEQLGTFLTQDSQGRYALFHLKLGEYLGQRKGEAHDDQPFSSRAVLDLHRRVANWCICDTTDLDGIWQHDIDPQEQMRRAYACQYYITHLYHGEAWDALWAVLDDGTYGRHKVRAYDPSARAYALDLDFGRQAASRQEVDFSTGLQLLPRLWFYSLLRCSLTSRADAYPDTYYQPLVLLGRAQEALGLAELLSSTQRKAHVFRLIALSLYSISCPSTATLQPNQLLLRAVELVRGFTDLQTAVQELSALSIAFDKLEDRSRAIGLIREAEQVAVGIESPVSQACALEAIVQAYAQVQQFDEAERVAAKIQINLFDHRILALTAIARSYAQAQRFREAERLLREAARFATGVRGDNDRARTWGAIAQGYAQVRRFHEAEQ